ncbi:MAG: superoxide dismutase [Deltaproteobacteria bacterium]
MPQGKLYYLPKLFYGYNQLAPFISEEQFRIHYEKHHRAYVDGANGILEKLDRVRRGNEDFDIKAAAKELSFNIGGHLFHSLFWGTLAPPNRAGGMPTGAFGDVVRADYGSFERFKKEFSQAAMSLEGSGWVAVAFCTVTFRLYIFQVEKHNIFAYPFFNPLMALDVFEHAYYLDYKNDRAGYVDAFWNLVDWPEVDTRFKDFVRAWSPESNPYRNIFRPPFEEYPF